MFDFFKRNKKTKKFEPNEKMIEATLQKGIDIGLTRDELVDMISRLDRSKNIQKIEKIVDRKLS